MENKYIVILIKWRYLMNFKKTLSFFGLLPLLVSCAGNSYYGEYSFQMGKSKDTHIAVTLELTKEKYTSTDGEEKGEKFSLGFDMMTSDVDDGFSELLKELTPLIGYYKVDKKTKVNDEASLKIGINLLGEYEVPQTITDAIFVASISSTAVNFYLPVSLEDLRYQLYWFGYDLSGDNIAAAISGDEDIKDPIVLPDDQHHPLDVHPTKADIDKINETYPDSHDGELFRDYHVLKLGLLKK